MYINKSLDIYYVSKLRNQLSSNYEIASLEFIMKSTSCSIVRTREDYAKTNPTVITLTAGTSAGINIR